MKPATRDQIRIALYNLVAAHAATIELMERTLLVLDEELALEATQYWKARVARVAPSSLHKEIQVDISSLRVTYHGRSCFLGGRLLFRLLEHLARRPNQYFTHEELLDSVWGGIRSDAAVRTAIGRLKNALRASGMEDLAQAIDGSNPGRYSLRLHSD